MGCGRIGTAVALRAKPFGFDVRFYDPHVPAGYDKALGITRCSSLAQLLEQSDCLSIHCDLNETSRGAVDGAALARMRRGSFVVNTARGGIIVEAALRACLDSGHIAGAGIDVHEVEPYFCSTPGSAPSAQPLAGSAAAICTPHTAFYSDESFVEIRTLAAGSVADALVGRPLSNVVNARWLPGSVDAGLRAPIVAGSR